MNNSELKIKEERISSEKKLKLEKIEMVENLLKANVDTVKYR